MSAENLQKYNELMDKLFTLSKARALRDEEERLALDEAGRLWPALSPAEQDGAREHV